MAIAWNCCGVSKPLGAPPVVSFDNGVDPAVSMNPGVATPPYAYTYQGTAPATGHRLEDHSRSNPRTRSQSVTVALNASSSTSAALR